MPNSGSFDRFVIAVHRRAVVIGVVERIGLCLATAAGLACLLTLAAGWRGVSAGPVVAMLIASAVVVGTAWGVIRRPRRLAAIMQADQQLHLADLLSSALTSSQDDFGQVVRAMAEKVCRTRSPSEVMLNRFGARAWGGIGLAWAMVLVVSLLAGTTNNTRAGETRTPIATRPPVDASPNTSIATGRPTVGGHEAASDDFSHLGSPQDKQTTSAAKTPNGKPTAPTDADGARSAQTSNGHNEKLPSPRSTNAAHPTDPLASSAAGNGVSSPNNRGVGPVGDGVNAKPAEHAAVPWNSDHWPADQAAAMQAVKDGQVPDAYRDLVRDYFSTAR